jgi:CheY-like chemotaxis protein
VAARRILVVENHAATRQLLVTLLEEAGYTVVAAEDGRTALLQTAHQRPDLILTDLRMPQMDGQGLLDTVRGDPSLRHIPVVVVTVHADVVPGRFDAVVRKPFDADTLLAEIAAVLDRRSST